MINKWRFCDAFLIAGMHRSGTSALAGTLHRMGLAVPRDLMLPDRANVKGYYESREVARLNNRMLRAAGSRWDNHTPIANSWFASPAADIYASEIRGFLDRNFEGDAPFLIKDPRLCRLLPLWLHVLDDCAAAVHVIIPLRHPDEVVSSLKSRDGLRESESYLLLLRHLLDVEAATRGRTRSFVLFDDLLQDWRQVVEDMVQCHGIRWPSLVSEAAPAIDRFLDRQLRHHHAGEGKSSNTARLLAGDVWDVFTSLARPDADVPTSAAAQAQLDQLRAKMNTIPPTSHWSPRFGATAARASHTLSRLKAQLCRSFSPKAHGQ
jgi:hypothetical protein